MDERGRWSRPSRCAMLSAIVSVALAIFGPPLSAQQPTAPAPAPAPAAALAFEGVTVIDVRDGRLLADQTVVISGNRVQAVGAARKVRVPPGAQVVDARGKYLIPGLWDMHAHVDDLTKRFYPVFIASGVTGVREMAQRFPRGADSFLVAQRDIAAGKRVGPRVLGPSADLVARRMGNTTEWPGIVQVTTPEDVRRAVDSLKAAGMVFIKFHDDRMAPALYFTFAREARRAGLPFVGHVPVGVTAAEAADSGQLSIEHINEVRCWMIEKDFSDKLDPDTVAADQRCKLAAAAMVRNGTWFVPQLGLTMALDQAQAEPDIVLPYVHRFIQMMYRAGVPLLAGTDVMGLEMRFSAWAAVHEELARLVEAGLTPLVALQTATLNPAKFIHATDSLGTVAPGKLADLVLLDANPLANIRNTTQIRAVVANGRYFDRAALDALDPDGAKMVKDSIEQR